MTTTTAATAVTAAIATLRVPGFHAWPTAPDRRAYLRDQHRHLFHIRVAVSVEHGDREIEIHDLMDEVRHTIEPFEVGARTHYTFGAMSCEHLSEYVAMRLASRLDLDFSTRRIDVEVLEDGEAGGRFTYDGRR
jgi:hypothetical protein